jgi:hypothetical protein
MMVLETVAATEEMATATVVEMVTVQQAETVV